MKAKTAAKPLALLSALLSMMLVQGPTKAGNGALGAGTACANEGTCCAQVGSICNDGGSTELIDKYYKSAGNCPG